MSTVNYEENYSKEEDEMLITINNLMLENDWVVMEDGVVPSEFGRDNNLVNYFASMPYNQAIQMYQCSDYNGKKPGEMLLFHGSSYEGIISQMTEGVNFNKSEPSGFLGQGMYFAARFQKSLAFAEEQTKNGSPLFVAVYAVDVSKVAHLWSNRIRIPLLEQTKDLLRTDRIAQAVADDKLETLPMPDTLLDATSFYGRSFPEFTGLHAHGIIEGNGDYDVEHRNSQADHFVMYAEWCMFVQSTVRLAYLIRLDTDIRA
jgi:hypothetical protein